MKTKKIATPEEWFKEFTPENVQVVMLCASTTTNDGTNSGGDGEDEELKPSSLEGNKSTGIYENNFSYNPFE